MVGFMIGLVLSGATAFPLPQELAWFTHAIGADASSPGLKGWIVAVRDALVETDRRYPFLAYGYDWLAFAHLVIAALFYGPYRDPVRNVWVLKWGVLACVAVIPLAWICGTLRDIPTAWRLIDCSFGVVGIVPLLIAIRDVGELESLTTR